MSNDLWKNLPGFGHVWQENYLHPFSAGASVQTQDGSKITLPTTAGKHTIDENGWLGEARILLKDGQLYLDWLTIYKRIDGDKTTVIGAGI